MFISTYLPYWHTRAILAGWHSCHQQWLISSSWTLICKSVTLTSECIETSLRYKSHDQNLQYCVLCREHQYCYQTCLLASSIFSLAVMAAAAMADAVGIAAGVSDIWYTFGGVTHCVQTQRIIIPFTEIYLSATSINLFYTSKPILLLLPSASGCVVECQTCNWEVAGLIQGWGYFAPRSTKPSIPPGSVNEYQLWLGRQKGRCSSFH